MIECRRIPRILVNSDKTKDKIPPLKPTSAVKRFRFKLSGPNRCPGVAYTESWPAVRIGKIEWSSGGGLASMDIEIWCGLTKLARLGER
jgi:hypothetical protein